MIAEFWQEVPWALLGGVLCLAFACLGMLYLMTSDDEGDDL